MIRRNRIALNQKYVRDRRDVPNDRLNLVNIQVVQTAHRSRYIKTANVQARQIPHIRLMKCKIIGRSAAPFERTLYEFRLLKPATPSVVEIDSDDFLRSAARHVQRDRAGIAADVEHALALKVGQVASKDELKAAGAHVGR